MKSIFKITTTHKTIVGFLFICSLLIQSVFATVTITKPTGGVNLSADYASDATAPNRKSLGNIVMTEQNTTAGKMDFTGSQTNVTLILTAPDLWMFRAGTGKVAYTASRDITSASIVVTDRTATVTFSTDSTPTLQDVLTISLLYVRPISGKYPPKLQYITRSSANPGTAYISGVVLNSTQFANLSMITGAISKLNIMMPGQSFVSGLGVSGSPISQLSGVSFVIPKIYATDQFLNIQPSYTGTKTLTWAGPTGSNIYTTSVAFLGGVSSTTLTTKINKEQTTALIVKQTTSYGYTGSIFTVANPIISIGAPSYQTLPSITTSTLNQDSILTPSGTENYFYVDDQKGLDAGYYTTIACSNLIAGTSTISNTNISVSTDGAVDLISGTSNPRVISDIGTNYQTCNNTLTFLRRNAAANSLITGRYGQFLNIKVGVPAWQKPGNYSSMITFTLIEN